MASIVSKRVMNAIQKADFGSSVETEDDRFKTIPNVMAPIGTFSWVNFIIFDHELTNINL